MFELLVFAALSPEPIEEIVVTSTRRDAPVAEHTGNVATIGSTTIAEVGHTHIHELLNRVPGVWIVRGSGQENLPALRSPVLTGAGSCGAFLTLENGVPTRPTGFCNVNQMFELATELADRIEIIRGPANALYGSNALHGTINVLLPDVASRAGPAASLELGPNDFWRTQAMARVGAARLGFVYADDGGFRDDSGYRQGKFHASTVVHTGGGDLSLWFTATGLDQETAGYILGEDAYRDPNLNRRNFNPEAYRKASSQRAAARWRGRLGGIGLDIRPYVRHSDMEFLQHFLPGQPLEANGHTSAGILTLLNVVAGDWSTDLGIDLEWADVFLRETQSGPTEGSDFLRETRPEGKHYDYDVRSLMAATFVQSEYRVDDRLTLSGGLRVEHQSYDYANNMQDGNTRDDGTACGFGGCLYTRPADRRDDFMDLAPKLGARWRIADSATLYANAARGFRAPQMTELYRLQNGQLVSDLDSETIDSIELGYRKSTDGWSVDASVFRMDKSDSVYRDAEGFNVSGARSRHRGFEVAGDVRLGAGWRLAANGTWARHRYESGLDIDTAPRWFGSAELRYEPSDSLSAALQWVSMGSYFLDPDNEYTYPGHDIANVRVHYALSRKVSITARFNNITDRAIADRADYAFGDYRYFPGRGREFFVRISYSAQATSAP